MKKTMGLWVFLCGWALGWAPAAPGMMDVSVLQYGARPGNANVDDTAAFQRALDEVVAAGGGRIHVPAGDYNITGRIAVKVPSEQVRSPNLRVALEGDGPLATRLMTVSGEGLFRFETTGNAMDVTIRDMGLLAAVPGAGTAIHIENPTLGVRVERGVLIERVHVEGLYRDSYFNRGISLYGQWRPLLRDLRIAGAESDSIADDSPSFRMEVGILQRGFYAGRFVNCHVRNAHTGIYWDAFDDKPGRREGFVVIKSRIERTRIGARLETPEQTPGGALTDTYIEARDIGFLMDHKRLLAAIGNTFKPLSPHGEYPYIDIKVCNSWAVQFNRNRFIGPAANRTHFRIDGRGDPKRYGIFPFSRFIQINENQFCLPVDRAITYSGDEIFGVYLEGNQQMEAR